MRPDVASRRSSPASLKIENIPCSLFSTRTFRRINLHDESILRIHSHLQCSRVKEFITLYDMYPRIRMGLLGPLLQQFWQDKHSTLLSNPFARGCIHLLRIDADAYNYGYKFRVFQVYSICLKQTLMESNVSRSRVLSFMVSLCQQLFSSPASWVSRRSSLFNEKPCSLFSTRTFRRINLHDESILRIHSHLQCSRVKEFITLYDMYPRIRGFVWAAGTTAAAVLAGQAFYVALKSIRSRLHSPTAHRRRRI